MIRLLFLTIVILFNFNTKLTAQLGSTKYPINSALSNNQDAINNTAFGERALANIYYKGADDNTGLGKNVLSNGIASVIFSGNTIAGYGACETGTDCINNTVVGCQALAYGPFEAIDYINYPEYRIKGITAVGSGALYANNAAVNNTAIGYQALYGPQTQGQKIYYGTPYVGFNTASGYQALKYNAASFNTAVGAFALFLDSLGFYNTGVGYKTLYSNKFGVSNTAIGYQSLYSNIGSDNTAIGSNALYNNKVGYHNSAIGFQSQKSNISAYNNISLGVNTLFNNVESNNIAIGVNALYNNIKGTQNIAIGVHSLYTNLTGAYNMAIGTYSLSSNNNGSNNTALGYQAITFNTGNNNVALGSNAGYLNSGSNNVFIGYGAGYTESGDNNLYIANNNVNTLIYGNFATNKLGIGTTRPISSLSIKPDVFGSKITLYDNGDANNHCGFGISSLQMNYHVYDNTYDHVFYAYGTNGNGTELMRIMGSGNVGIGNTPANLLKSKLTVNGTALIGDPAVINSLPIGYNLYVQNGILADSVNVTLKEKWADYVFEEDYELKNFEQIEQYIKTYKHLPNIPSAEEVSKNGIDIADMKRKMLEKIEELHLYMFKINDNNKEIERRIQNKF